MNINIYDFDKTIYDGDSSIDFYKFCLKKKKTLIIRVFPFLFHFFLHRLSLISKEKLKSSFFSFLTKFDDIDILVDDFWLKNTGKIKEFYLNKDHSKDVIITASPEFLIKPVADKLNVKCLIGSVVDKKTGAFLSKNCKGIEKVNRLYDKFNKDIKVINVYSDSYSDTPIFDLGKNNYLVRGEDITKIK